LLLNKKPEGEISRTSTFIIPLVGEMRNEIKKEKPPSNKEVRSYIIEKFFRSYFKKFMYNIRIGGMPLLSGAQD